MRSLSIIILLTPIRDLQRAPSLCPSRQSLSLCSTSSPCSPFRVQSHRTPPARSGTLFLQFSGLQKSQTCIAGPAPLLPAFLRATGRLLVGRTTLALDAPTTPASCPCLAPA